MDSFFRLVQKVRPHRRFETCREKFLLGRSRDCEIVIPEPQVSRRQAEVWFENGRHYIRNLGRNILRLNDRPTTGDFLENGDEITFGENQFTYHAQAPATEGDGSEARTLLVPEPSPAPAAQRLVCAHPTGRTTTHALIGEKFLIGRSSGADLAVGDPSVSRRHCLIEKRGDAYFACNISESNPMAINERIVTEKRLSSGDRLKIGPYVISFFSSLREDARAMPRNLKLRLTPRWRAIAGLAVVLASAALLYMAWGPWKTGRELEAIAQRISGGADAREELSTVLEQDLSPDHRQFAQKLWAQSTLEIARRRVREGHLAAAIDELERHIALPAAGKETAELRELLHEAHLLLGRQLEAGQDPQQALAHYGVIPEDTPHFTEARKSILRLWQVSQREHYQQQTVRQLLQEAEILFNAQCYLTPLRQNAYSLYQAVLAIEPGNEPALKRIDEIKGHYRSEGEKRLKAGEWPQALTAFERYSLIDPDAADIRQKMSICTRKLAQPETPAVQKPTATKRPRPPAEAGERRRVEQLLEESGAQSPWIIKYLFDEKTRADESETPW